MGKTKGERVDKKHSKGRRKALGPTKPRTKNQPKLKNKNKKKKKISKNENKGEMIKVEKPRKVATSLQLASPPEQLKYFLEQFESANAVKLSSLELDSIHDSYFVKLSEGTNQDASNLGEHVKDVFGSTWKEVLCEPQLVEGRIDAGNPAVLVVSASAIRALEMLRGLRILTKECQAVKLFSKHMKVDDQVAMLKKRVNVASGTPNRIKKLCEMEALGLSRLEVIVLDMHPDMKGYSLLTLPQVRDEFWDLYKSYFHQRLLQGNLRVCLYGPIPVRSGSSITESEDH